MNRRAGLLFIFTLALGAGIMAGVMTAAPRPAQAIGANEALADPVREARARALFKQLRCLVCQNQSIDDSEADLARDLRMLVRQRIEAGDSDADVLRFLTARYGDFVLLKPPFKTRTLVLWLAPFTLLLIGIIYIAMRRRRAAAGPLVPVALSAAEHARLDALLGGKDENGHGGPRP